MVWSRGKKNQAMTINRLDVPRFLLERVKASYPAPAYFTAQEFVDWPHEALRSLQEQELVQSAGLADVWMCEGCHWCCFKPVIVKRQTWSRSAFIVCDEEPDLGRIGVPLGQLQRYRSSISLLATFLRKEFNLAVRAQITPSPPILLGYTKGRHGKRSVSLLFDPQQLVVRVGDHSARVADFLTVVDGQLTADRALLRKLADRKQRSHASRPRYQPDRTIQRTKAKDTAQRDRAIRAEAHRIREQTGQPLSDIARDLANQRCFHSPAKGGRQPLSAGRIYRILYEDGQS